MITKAELLMGRDVTCPVEYTDEISTNIDRLLKVMNEVREAYAKPMTIASGWRPLSINSKVSHAAKKSNHMKGLACDVHDAGGELRKWVLENLELMQKLGLYFEDFRWTQGWVHFQIIPPASGHRIFVPYADTVKNPMTNHLAWSGEYDSKFNGVT